MNGLIAEALAFLAGTLFYGFRSQLGKWMMQGLLWLIKWLFRLSKSEAELYHQQRKAAQAARNAGRRK